MDLVFIDFSGDETGMVNYTEILDIVKHLDIINQREVFKIVMEYNDTNWLKIRDAKYFKDVDVPNIKVTIDQFNISNKMIVVVGSVSEEEAVEWMMEL